MDYEEDSLRPVSKVTPVSRAERISRILRALSLAGTRTGERKRPPARKPAGRNTDANPSRNFRLLSLTRAVNRFNGRPPIVNKKMNLSLLIEGDTFTIRLLRKPDGAVLHQSRPLPLSSVNAANVNLILEQFLKQEQSLARFEQPWR